MNSIELCLQKEAHYLNLYLCDVPQIWNIALFEIYENGLADIRFTK